MNAPDGTAATVVAADRWERYWSRARNEDFLAARVLAELSPRVRELFAACVKPDPDGGPGALELDWAAAAVQVDRQGLSSTEYRLARLVLALTTRQPLDLASLSWMGSWQDEVWRVLVQWASGGALTTVNRAATRRRRLSDREWAEVTGVWR